MCNKQHINLLDRFYFILIYFILFYFEWFGSLLIFKTYKNTEKTAHEFHAEFRELIEKIVKYVLKFSVWAILWKLEEHVAWFKLNESISLCKIICLVSLVEDKEGEKHGNFTGICTEICSASHWPCCIPSLYLRMHAMCSVGHCASARKEIKMGNK